MLDTNIVSELARNPQGVVVGHIAAHSLALGTVLVTANVGEFSRVGG